MQNNKNQIILVVLKVKLMASQIKLKVKLNKKM